VKNLVTEPMVMQLPDYFIRSETTSIVANRDKGFNLYTTAKPVKPVTIRVQ
jgi:hypothetical protein